METANTLDRALTFLAGLKQNNQKAWFDAHRSDYEAARTVFEDLIDGVIDEFRQTDRLQDLRARQCVARIYRDVRFSKDKSPYKTNLGAMVAPGGWRSDGFGYYIALEPGGESLAAGGLYSPTPAQLERFRAQIAKDPSEFERITSATDFRALFGEAQGERLKTAPKGYDREHAQIGLLRLKQVYAAQRFSDSRVCSPGQLERVIQACRVMRPFLDYLRDICGEPGEG